jgi:hypothetical protein
MAIVIMRLPEWRSRAWYKRCKSTRVYRASAAFGGIRQGALASGWAQALSLSMQAMGRIPHPNRIQHEITELVPASLDN